MFRVLLVLLATLAGAKSFAQYRISGGSPNPGETRFMLRLSPSFFNFDGAQLQIFSAEGNRHAAPIRTAVFESALRGQDEVLSRQDLAAFTLEGGWTLVALQDGHVLKIAPSAGARGRTRLTVVRAPDDSINLLFYDSVDERVLNIYSIAVTKQLFKAELGVEATMPPLSETKTALESGAPPAFRFVPASLLVLNPKEMQLGFRAQEALGYVPYPPGYAPEGPALVRPSDPMADANATRAGHASNPRLPSISSFGLSFDANPALEEPIFTRAVPGRPELVEFVFATGRKEVRRSNPGGSFVPACLHFYAFYR